MCWTTEVDLEIGKKTLRVKTNANDANAVAGNSAKCKHDNLDTGLISESRTCCILLPVTHPTPLCAVFGVVTVTWQVGPVVSFYIEDIGALVTACCAGVQVLAAVIFTVTNKEDIATFTPRFGPETLEPEGAWAALARYGTNFSHCVINAYRGNVQSLGISQRNDERVTCLSERVRSSIVNGQLGNLEAHWVSYRLRASHSRRA